MVGFITTLCGMGPVHENFRVSPTRAETGGSSGEPKGMTQSISTSAPCTDLERAAAQAETINASGKRMMCRCSWFLASNV